MKIAVVAPTHIPARRANTIQVMKMTDALAALGNDVILASPGTAPDSITRKNLTDHYGIKHQFPIDWIHASPVFRRYDYALRAFFWARHNNADLLYTRLPQTATFASLAGFPTILEIHDVPRGNFGPLIFRGFAKGRGAKRLVVISHALAEDLLSDFSAPESHNFTIIAPDGVDLSRYIDLPAPIEARRALSNKLKINPDVFTAGYSGHLYKGRGISQILNMASRIPGINFLLIGGEQKDVERVRTMIKSSNLQNVTLTGFIPNKELPEYQAACEVLLMPYQSRVSGSSGGDISRYLSPMKLFEYLACGRAIMSSNLPVIQEILSPKEAVLLPPADLSTWTKALKELREDNHLRSTLANAARESARNYTWQARAERMLNGLV